MKNKSKILIVLLLATLVVIIVSVPSEDDVYVWISEKHGIILKDYSKDIENPDYRTGLYELNGDKVHEMSSHIRAFGLFMTVEKDFKYDDGSHLTIRGLGFLNRLYHMKDNKIWELLN